MKKLVLAAATVAAAIAVSSPALASPCGSGWKIIGREGNAWVCQNIETGVTRLVGG